MSTYNLAHQLARELGRCEERKAYDLARGAIEHDEGAVFMLRDFRRRQVELEVNSMQGKKPSDEEMAQLHKLAEAISLHRPVSDFLSAEMRLVQVVSDVQKIIGESLGLWDYISMPDEKENTAPK